jgi:hypothetical protein
MSSLQVKVNDLGEREMDNAGYCVIEPEICITCLDYGGTSGKNVT